MSVQYAEDVRNAQLDAIETVVGVSPLIRFYNGTPPANVAAALSGNTLIAEGTLPADWLAAAATGSKAKAGTWTMTGQTGASTGTASTFGRILTSGGTAKIQFTVTATGGGGDVTLNNNNIADGQSVTVSAFTISAANS